ncbi:Branched-chain alpha-keto acid dehydrogenase, E1 component, alpha subunit [Brachybacterium faecium]|uniref:2-oxoisovalerate dehydrogenase subunit alpha n=1 Tax=Brachybacterium faecium (strain ATCC 43885 / DSM 4810 / JCM 11609 / LMG 19847 / NBRC 14762 / NCIMB 9860 / 6-10) TaxID=446465 RepID=C7MF25_BRAFD|nr:thiamine pyrophosphate-dependent enzyme [Brachybacterium faecium]ACU83925.1 pyruvate/2-oxoglutarate dehydrogenase complex, dehydrogenase component alpha subunit [Brachybacterium faecium DSM 4810]SLN04418.1 Branched-chain alpha-keto acid dehydrogenase, E1 component, alpha subunit [Brachybacterium faecium]HJG53391.1 pyruvate dehydrogenase (acetyl-transferring) E1 component subunit alpha [Brachybacterium faecium]
MLTTPSAPGHDLVAGLAQPLHVLAEDGTRHPDPILDPALDDVDEALLTELYLDMSVIRAIDEEAVALQRQGELGLWPPLHGQEAAQIGLGRALDATEFLFTSYRENGLAWCRGVSPEEMLAVWRGTALSGWDPFTHHMATPQVIIGAQAHHAVGYAMAARARGGDEIAVACFGDGALSQGDVNEALAFAASFRAPVLFFCQNNHYAISEPVAVQATVPLALRPTGFGIPALRVDGNDVLAVRAASRIAARHLREGRGPIFLEAVTYRLGPHTTSDDPTRYRDEQELETWRGRCPLRRVERHLAQLGASAEELRGEAQRRGADARTALREAVTALPAPAPESLFENVLSTAHPGLERQREEFRSFTASLAPEGTEDSAS